MDGAKDREGKNEAVCIKDPFGLSKETSELALELF
jgi:hypothetical protein